MPSPFLSNDNAAFFGNIVETLGKGSLGLQLSGEKGLGKEAIVRMLYARSPYRGYPFIKVNCPMLSGNNPSEDSPCITEAGSQPNNSSFSLFRLFHQGVLYLHAVDELDMELQARLLTMIERKFISCGSASGGSTGGMLIFSTSTRPLDACVASGTFYPALGELLSGVSIHIPPLRHSPERIGPLANYFLKRCIFREGYGSFSQPSGAHLALMSAYRWPGNVQELQGVVRQALRFKDWDAALDRLTHRNGAVDDYAAINLTPDGVALMPDFEITQGRMLKRLSERVPADELGLMDLVIYEEVIANKKMH